MPNVEIHGYGRLRAGVGGRSIFEVSIVALELQGKVVDLFLEAPYRDDVVITLVNDHCHDLTNRMREFIRLVSTPQDYIPDVLVRLKTLGIDVEVLMLSEFHQGKT